MFKQIFRETLQLFTNYEKLRKQSVENIYEHEPYIRILYELIYEYPEFIIPAIKRICRILSIHKIKNKNTPDYSVLILHYFQPTFPLPRNKIDILKNVYILEETITTGNVQKIQSMQNEQNIQQILVHIRDHLHLPVTQTASNVTTPVTQTASNVTSNVTQNTPNVTPSVTQTASNVTPSVVQNAPNVTPSVVQNTPNVTPSVVQNAPNVTTPVTQTASNVTTPVTQNAPNVENVVHFTTQRPNVQVVNIDYRTLVRRSGDLFPRVRRSGDLFTSYQEYTDKYLQNDFLPWDLENHIDYKIHLSNDDILYIRYEYVVKPFQKIYEGVRTVIESIDLNVQTNDESRAKLQSLKSIIESENLNETEIVKRVFKIYIELFLYFRKGSSTSTKDNRLLRYHILTHPQKSEGSNIYEQMKNVQTKFYELFTFEFRDNYVEKFLIPFLRSSCFPFCVFQDLGSKKATSDTDISVINTRGHIMKKMAQEITTKLLKPYIHLLGTDVPSEDPSIYSVRTASDVLVSTKLSLLLDTNVYALTWYDFCFLPTSLYPSLTPIDQCELNRNQYFKGFEKFYLIQLSFSVARILMHFIDHDDPQQKQIRDLLSLDKKKYTTIPPIKLLYRNIIPYVLKFMPGFSSSSIPSARNRNTQVERENTLDKLLKVMETILRKYQYIMSYKTKEYRNESKEKLNEILLEVQEEYRHKIVSIQSILNMYEEEAYYTIAGYLDVVVRQQKKQELNEPDILYLMSFLENVGFYYENYSCENAKYYNRSIEALKKFVKTDTIDLNDTSIKTKINETITGVLNDSAQYKPYDPEIITNVYGPPENWQAFDSNVNAFGRRNNKIEYKWVLLPDPRKYQVISHVRKGPKFLCAKIK